MAESSNVIVAAFIVTLLVISFLVLEINRLNYARESTLAVQRKAEQIRFEQKFDSVLLATHPIAKETIAELIGDCSYYGPQVLTYGGRDLNTCSAICEIFDGIYGKENYLLYIPISSKLEKKGTQIIFILDTSRSMEDDYARINTAISYIRSQFPKKDINFYVYTLYQYIPIGASCSLSNVTCSYISGDELEGLCAQAGIPQNTCVLSEAWALGIAWWAKQNSAESPNTVRIIIPASDELSCSDAFIYNGIPMGGEAIADKSIEFALRSIQGYENLYIYPMLCSPEGVNNPNSLPQKHDENAILEDMNRLATATLGDVIDFSEGYSQEGLNNILSKIVVGHVSRITGTMMCGTAKEEDRYSFERFILRPDDTNISVRMLVYMEQKPHEENIITIREPPVAIISYSPRIINERPYTVTFDGRLSYDPDGGSIVKYLWKVDDKEVSNDASFSYTFNSEGKHVVTLTVTDDEGDEGSATIVLDVGSKLWTLVFVPVNWRGSDESFNTVAMKHFQHFVQAADLDNCSTKYRSVILKPSEHNCNIPQLKRCMNDSDRVPVLDAVAKCAKKAGYALDWGRMRIVGLTQDDIRFLIPGIGCASGVVGFTEIGPHAVLGEYRYINVTAHELGHTFIFCEQYAKRAWEFQNKVLAAPYGGCKNYYPDGSTHCKEYGSLITRCPEATGSSFVDCYGRKIPIGSAIGRSVMGPEGIPGNPPRKYDCFEMDVVRGALKCS